MQRWLPSRPHPPSGLAPRPARRSASPGSAGSPRAPLAVASIAALTFAGTVIAQDSTDSNDGAGDTNRADGADGPLGPTLSDPHHMGWMQGHPPPDDRIIRAGDPAALQFPQLRWSMCHFRELEPSAAVSRGTGAMRALERDIDMRLDEVSFTVRDTDRSMTWHEAFDANYIDGLVVLHRGRIVYERYAGCHSLADLVGERIWTPIGAERDALYVVDAIGTPWAGGGFSGALRDMARWGQPMLDGGRVDGR